MNSDAARHAMNGALIYDWLREGPWSSPADYANWYYARWPVLSLDYHPPVLPILEAIAFIPFGVSPLAARLVVALSAACSSILLYRLVLATHGAHVLAISVSVVFFALPLTQGVAQDVMLEVPALLFVLSALLPISRLQGQFSSRNAVLFACWGTLAVLTKQVAIFAAAIPFLYAVLTGRLPWLRSRALWLATICWGLAFATLMLVTTTFGYGTTSRVPDLSYVGRAVAANTRIYLGKATSGWGLLAAVIVTGGLIMMAFVGTSRREQMKTDGLYWAWLVAILLVLLVGEWNNERYLFFAAPPLVTLGLAFVSRALRVVMSPQKTAWFLAASTALIAVGACSRDPVVFAGPAEAAGRVSQDRPTRVLYAGEADGQFTFALRSVSRTTDLVVIRGEKLPDYMFEPETFDHFARRHGVSHVVLERTTRFVRPWDRLIENPTPSMGRHQEIAVSGYRTGAVHVYRFWGARRDPVDSLEIDGDRMRRRQPQRLDWSRPPWREERR